MRSCAAFRQPSDHRKFHCVCLIPADIPREKNENIFEALYWYISHDISLRIKEDGVAVKTEIDHFQG
jgi:hypothetical protein